MKYTELKYIAQNSKLNINEAIIQLIESNMTNIESMCVLAVGAEKNTPKTKPKTIWQRAKLFVDDKNPNTFSQYCYVFDNKLYAGGSYDLMVEDIDSDTAPIKNGFYHPNGQPFDGLISYPIEIIKKTAEYALSEQDKNHVDINDFEEHITLNNKEYHYKHGVFDKKYIDKLKRIGIKKLLMNHKIAVGKYDSGIALAMGIKK